MKRIALVALVVVGLLGTGGVLAAPSGVNRVVLAKGIAGDVHIDAKGPVEIRHGVATVEPGGTTDWISWPGTVVATLEGGGISYRNNGEQDCAAQAVAPGYSFVVAAGSVFEIVNSDSETAEVHFVAFMPPDAKLTLEQKPANC